MKIFEICMERYCKNVRIIVDFLNKYLKVEKVYYFGFEIYFGYEIVKK